MKPSLQLRFSQQLTMTPQLQQAIKLLQLSTLDLQAEIQEALDSNPLLELDESNDSGNGEKSLETNHNADSKENDQAEVNADNVDSADALQNNDIPEDLPQTARGMNTLVPHQPQHP
jgi:RNA polymerase sigma-54 factor